MLVQTCGGVSRLEYLKTTKSDEGGSNPQHHRTPLLFGVATVECITRDSAVRRYDRASSGGGNALHDPIFHVKYGTPDLLVNNYMTVTRTM